MDKYSCLSIINRPLTKFHGLIEAMTGSVYTETSLLMQKRLQGLYSALLEGLYEGLEVEYYISNENGHWVEHVYLREDHHDTAHMVAVLDTSGFAPEYYYGSMSTQHRWVKKMLDILLSDDEHAHVLFHEKIRKFALDAADEFMTGHGVMLEADDGIVQFRVVPFDGGGMLTLLSRSQICVIDSDADMMEGMYPNEQPAAFFDGVRTH